MAMIARKKFVKFEELNSMDEAFLTSSTYGIIPCYWDDWTSSYNKVKKIKKILNKKLT